MKFRQHEAAGTSPSGDLLHEEQDALAVMTAARRALINALRRDKLMH